MPCFITRTASFLPGPAIENDQIEQYLGTLPGEAEVKEKVLTMNGIVRRHYARDPSGQQTHDVYDLGAEAASACLAEGLERPVSCIAAGTTFAPLAAPGYSSLLHARLAEKDQVSSSVEIQSHAGICSSAATALVSAIRAVESGSHATALCVGAEQSSAVIHADSMRPIDDRAEHENIRNSQWFMSVFLRFMLSDGAGAMLLQDAPAASGLSLKVNWTHARSFAHEAPLCMKLESRTALLSQDVSILSSHLVPCSAKFVPEALKTNRDTIDSHQIILPHMSSFFFRRKMERVIARNCEDQEHSVPFWTNLATAGNTGTASIFIMLAEYLRSHQLRDGDKLLLFVPESGQFNFVMISLTAVKS